MITNNIVYTKFSAYRFNIKKALGSYIWDDSDKQYIDFTSGWNVTNLGWDNQEVIDAGMKQLETNSYSPMWTLDKTQDIYAQTLTKAIGHNLTVVARATGGMESIEMAIKTARAYTGRKKILGFFEQFHGSSINALSLGYRPEWIAKLTDVKEDFIHLEYPRIYKSKKTEKELLQELEIQLNTVLKNEDVAAVITEVGIITGWGSTHVAPEGFIDVIRKVTKKYGTLLIIDEIGTGFSRLGSLFGIHHVNVEPDIICLAKAIANGSGVMAAMVTTKKIAEETYLTSNLQSTFGWNPVACAMAQKTLEIHQRDNTARQATEKGIYMKDILNKELRNNPLVGDIRGMGMEIGVDLRVENAETVVGIVNKAFKSGLHIVCDYTSNIQLMPPLTIEKEVLDKGLEILISTIKKNGYEP